MDSPVAARFCRMIPEIINPPKDSIMESFWKFPQNATPKPQENPGPLRETLGVDGG